MFLDTAFNSLQTVKTNISTAFTETAIKMWMYARCLGKGKRPSSGLVCREFYNFPSLLSLRGEGKCGRKWLTRKTETIENLVNLAFVLMKSKAKNKKNVGYKCGLTKVQVEWYVVPLSLFLSWKMNLCKEKCGSIC